MPIQQNDPFTARQLKQAAREAARLAAAEEERVKALAEVERQRTVAKEIDDARAKIATLEEEERKRKECGHVNAHYTGDHVLKCVLPPAHTGNHRGVYNRAGEDVETEWKDEAGYAINK